MGDYSKSPQQMLTTALQSGYVGVHIQQGVPVLDRDLNLLNDLISVTVRNVVSRYIGNGVAANREGFAIQAIPATNDFRILAGPSGPGTCLVGGTEVTIETAITYNNQTDVPPLTTPTAAQPNPRVDTVFLDVWLTEVEGTMDPALLNSDDIGVQTSVRLKPAWLVRVAEGVQSPSPDTGHTHYILAQITRPLGEDQILNNMIVDQRQTIRALAQVEDRLNFLETLIVIPAFEAPPNEFAPNLGGAGTNVTLSGRNFNIGSPTVLFDSTEATIVGTPTATEIVTVVPAGLSGPVKISVITNNGSAITEEDFVVLPSAPPGDPPEFAPPPDEFSPNLGGVNTPVTLLGNNFDGPNLQVAFDGVNATIDSINTGTTPMEIVALVPAGISGLVNISITTDFGTVTSIDSFGAL